MYIKVMYVAQIYYILVGLPPFIEGFETRSIASSSPPFVLYSIPQSMVSYDIAIVSLGLDLEGAYMLSVHSEGLHLHVIPTS